MWMASVPEVALYSDPETERAKEKRQEGFPERQREKVSGEHARVFRGEGECALQPAPHTEKRGCDFVLFGGATHTRNSNSTSA